MLHVQDKVPGIIGVVEKLPGGSVVKGTQVQFLSEAKAANPNIFTVLRYVNDNMKHVSADDTDEVRAERARAWFNAFIDGTFLDGETAGVPHHQVNAICWWNEYYDNGMSAAEKQLWLRQERVAALIWLMEYRNGPHAFQLHHIKLVIGSVPVENDVHIDTARTAKDYDCIVDYHAYDHFIGDQRDPLSWVNHCGRWALNDADFVAMGERVTWLLGETGLYLDAYRGWKDINTDMVEELREFYREIKFTDAYQEGRLLGFCLFTTGGGDLWESFELGSTELLEVIDMIEEESAVVIPPSKYVTVEAIPFLNLRAGPGIHHRDVGDLHPNDQPLEVIAEKQGVDGVWYQLNIWAKGEFLPDV